MKSLFVQNATRHAEMVAIDRVMADNDEDSVEIFQQCTVYVNVEPCIMCAGALKWSQISAVVYAASDPQKGYQQAGLSLHPKTSIRTGVLAKEAKYLLEQFFIKKRK